MTGSAPDPERNPPAAPRPAAAPASASAPCKTRAPPVPLPRRCSSYPWSDATWPKRGRWPPGTQGWQHHPDPSQPNHCHQRANRFQGTRHQSSSDGGSTHPGGWLGHPASNPSTSLPRGRCAGPLGPANPSGPSPPHPLLPHHAPRARNPRCSGPAVPGATTSHPPCLCPCLHSRARPWLDASPPAWPRPPPAEEGAGPEPGRRTRSIPSLLHPPPRRERIGRRPARRRARQRLRKRRRLRRRGTRLARAGAGPRSRRGASPGQVHLRHDRLDGGRHHLRNLRRRVLRHGWRS